jgi:outer membrane protein assembly factor BamB
VYTPSVAAATAYLVAEDGAVVALDARTGAIRWEAATAGINEVAPLLVGDLVLVASNDGAVHAFDVADGTERWRVPTEGVPYTPTVAAGTLLVPTALGELTAYGDAS